MRYQFKCVGQRPDARARKGSSSGTASALEPAVEVVVVVVAADTLPVEDLGVLVLAPFFPAASSAPGGGGARPNELAVECWAQMLLNCGCCC